MSSSSEFSETAASGTRTTPEKSSTFSQTCDRLREYLKEGGSLGITLGADTGFGMSSGSVPNEPMLLRSPSSMTLFPQMAGVGSGLEDGAKVGEYRGAAMAPEKAQMTIFYGGQVMVFNEMPANKALEIMRLAGKASARASGSQSPAGLGVASPESVTKISQPVLREIPIARKQSLARFLEKRKDRIMSRAPYMVNSSTKASPPSFPADKSWLGLAANTQPLNPV